MTLCSRFLRVALLPFISGCCYSIGYAQQPPPTPAVSSPVADLPPVDPSAQAINDAYRLLFQEKSDEALAKINPVIQANPKNVNAYMLRGNIYVQKKLYDQAQKDYETVAQLDGKNTAVKFNLSEIKFLQKKYDDAQVGFAALKTDSTWGDLANYKVFLCNLLGGHEDVAAKELDTFNQVGSNPSYYFANAAWALIHHKPEDARPWLKSIVNIYPAQKIALYASSLKALGYLPLPAPPPPAN